MNTNQSEKNKTTEYFSVSKNPHVDTFLKVSVLLYLFIRLKLTRMLYRNDYFENVIYSQII